MNVRKIFSVIYATYAVPLYIHLCITCTSLKVLIYLSIALGIPSCSSPACKTLRRALFSMVFKNKQNEYQAFNIIRCAYRVEECGVTKK